MSHILIQGHAPKMLKTIVTGSVDMVLTSPPYDNVRHYNGFSFNKRVFQAIARELYRVLKDGGVLVWVVADQTKNGTESGTSFEQALYFKNTVGFKLHDTMIYKRSNPPLTHRRYEQGFEYMFVFVKGNNGPATFNGIRAEKSYPEAKPRVKNWHREPDGTFKIGTNKIVSDKLIDNVWSYGGPNATDSFAREHPAVFPEKLAADHIHSWSVPGDLILDPMCGSGTTGKQAVRMGRAFIGFDVSSEYLELAEKRIAAEGHSVEQTREIAA